MSCRFLWPITSTTVAALNGYNTNPRAADLYLDTLYSAFEMIASGITTVQHLHGWVPGGREAVEAGAGEVIRAPHVRHFYAGYFDPDATSPTTA